jgi:two-component system chemotaxis response regulator CheB
VGAGQIGALLARLVRERAAAAPPPSDQLRREIGYHKGIARSMPAELNLGTPSSFTCPECGGALWELVNGEQRRYRCHVGHALSAESALESQNGVVEQSLWAAVRALEEGAGLARRVGQHSKVLHDDLERRARQSEAHAEVIRKLLAGS